MSSLGSTPRLRTNTRMLLEKAFQEDQRKRQKMMSSPRGHNASKTHPSLTTNHGINQHNNSAHNGIVFRNNGDVDVVRPSHLEPILSDDFGDSVNTPYSLTPSSMTTSVSEYDTLFEDINEIVEKESHVNNSFLSDKIDKTQRSKPPTKAPLKTSSSCPTMRSNTRLTLPSKLDPSDFPDIDAYKKEKHNIVEKKRRYKINDCIQELADLLPQTYDVDLNMKKGYILEKSVEYIHELKKDSEKKMETEGRMKELERENRQLQLELQALRRSQQASIRLQQQQQQHQQQQQFLLLSPSYPPQQQQQHSSPHSNPLILNLGDQFLNNGHQHHQHQQQRHTFNNNNNNRSHAHFRNNPAPFDSDFPPPTNEELMLVDADSLMSNLQVSSELNDLDRQELNDFINLDDDIMMSDLAFQ